MVDDGKLDVLDRVGLQVPSWAVPNFPPTGLDNRGSLEVPIPGDNILITLQGEKSVQITKEKEKHLLYRALSGHGDIEDKINNTTA